MKHILKSILLLCALFTATNTWADNSWFVNNEDYSNKIGTWEDVGSSLGEGWHNFGGTLDRSGVALTEWWRGTGPSSGKVMRQTFTGLPAGKYTIEIYANAMESGSASTNGAKVAEAYANGATKAMPLMHKDMSVPTLHTIDATVGSDGKLEVGINSTASGANWFAAKIKSITYRGANDIAHNDEGTWWNRQNNNDNPGSYGKGGVILRESYLTNATTKGDMVTKTLTGLANGYYHVSLFATASYTSGRGFDSPATDGDMNCSFVYAGTQDASIPVVYRADVLQAPDRYTFYNVKVTDGTLKVGVRNDKGGANWHLLAVDYIHYMGDKPDYSYQIQENVMGNWGAGENYMNFGYKEVGKYMGNSHTQSVGTPISGKVTGLQVGLYELTVHCTANWADWSESAPVAEGTEDCTVIIANGIRQSVPIHQGKQPAEQQTYTLSNIPVDESGEMNISVVNEEEGANWITFSTQRLVWTGTDTRLQANALRGLIATAQRRTDDVMSATLSGNLTSAINAALALVGIDPSFVVTATEEELGEATTALQAAIAAIDTWQEEWAAAKAPLIAAMERFEADYNDGVNGALRPMSAEAWTTLVTAAGVAAKAKDNIEDLSALATAAATFHAAMDAAEPSITLYNKYELLMNGLNRYNAEQFPLADCDTEANHVTDAAVTAAIATMNTAWETYKATLEGNQDVTAMTGVNLGFEEAEGTQSLTPTTNGNHSYAQPNWEMTVTNTTNVWEFAGQTTDIPSNSTSIHSLRVYANWTTSGDVMQVKQSTTLPVGNYRLDVALKMVDKNWSESLNYIEVGNTRYALDAGSTWETVSKDFEIVEPTLVTISFGHVAKGGNNKMDVYADDITLTLFNQTTYERYYETAKAMKDGGSTSLALASALAQYSEATEAGATTAGYDIGVATGVLQNAIVMAEDKDDATALVANPQFADGTADGWTHYENIEGYNDVSVKADGSLKQFNVWGDKIMYSDLYQQLQNLPNGTYELTANFQTYTAENRKTVGNGKRSADGYSWISLYADNFDESGAPRIMRSTNIGHGEGLEDDARHDYTIYIKVVNNIVNIGVRSDYTYYRVTDFRLQMVDADTHKVDVAKAVVYDAMFNPAKANDLSFDLTAANYADAVDVDLRTGGFVQQPNALIKASKDGQIAGNNVIVGGTCANLVLTDKAPFDASADFTATSATYTRNMANTWGTIMLPYAVNSNENVQFYTLNKVVDGEDGYMSFVEAETLAANTPGVFVKQGDGAESITLTGSGTVPASTNINAVTGTDDAAGWTLNGTFTAKTFEDVKAETDEYYYISADCFWHATGRLTVAPFRAWFTSSQASEVRSFRLVVGEDDADEIRLVPTDASAEHDVYTLSGVRLPRGSQLKPGIYIINNKKTVVK